MSTVHQQHLIDHIHELLNKGEKREFIVSSLVDQGHEEAFAHTFVQETAAAYYYRQRCTGINCIIAGAIICFISCVLSITASYTHLNFPFVLYGLTSLGILVAFAGFVKIF